MPDRVAPGPFGGSSRLQEVSPNEYAPQIFTRDAWSAGVGLGRAYILGTGRLTLSVAGNMRVLISNPANSGTLVTVHAIAALATAMSWATTHKNPTTGLPTADPAQVIRANSQVGQAPVTQLRADTNATTALSGGASGPTIPIAPNQRIELKLGVLLFPGESLGFNNNFTGGADLGGSVYVVEEAL